MFLYRYSTVSRSLVRGSTLERHHLSEDFSEVMEDDGESVEQIMLEDLDPEVLNKFNTLNTKIEELELIVTK